MAAPGRCICPTALTRAFPRRRCFRQTLPPTRRRIACLHLSSISHQPPSSFCAIDLFFVDLSVLPRTVGWHRARNLSVAVNNNLCHSFITLVPFSPNPSQPPVARSISANPIGTNTFESLNAHDHRFGTSNQQPTVAVAVAVARYRGPPGHPRADSGLATVGTTTGECKSEQNWAKTTPSPTVSFARQPPSNRRPPINKLRPAFIP